MDKELQYKYQKMSLSVLQKALDEICPKLEDKEQIEERKKLFQTFESEIDSEWEELEKEAAYELELFEQERNLIFSKIEKTRNRQRVQAKVEAFEQKKDKRVEYLQKKLKEELATEPAQPKLLRLIKSYNDKIYRTEFRYNTIINNTINSDNSDSVDRRLAISKKVWDRKYKELKFKFELKEIIHHNKRMEYDQIRLSIQGFEEEFKRVALWCIMAGITPLTCYTEVKERMQLIDRDTTVIDAMIEDIKLGNLSIDK